MPRIEHSLSSTHQPNKACLLFLMGAKLSFKSSIKMGCAISGATPKSGGDGNSDVGLPHLSDDQIQMIKESWKVIRDDIAKVGIIMFVRLFETHPECKDVFFLFRDVEDLERLRTSRELRAHGLRVMSFIEKSVARLDQLERLEALAVELGKSHYRYNAPPRYYSYVGAEFIGAVQPILKEQWTPELEEAWKTMFLYVTGLMKQGYQEEERTRLQQESTSPKERPDKRNTVL